MQVLSTVAASASEDFPGTQAIQEPLVLPVCVLYLPASHGKQSEASSCSFASLPGASLYLPAAQSSQSVVVPVLAEYFPRPQTMQSASSSC